MPVPTAASPSAASARPGACWSHQRAVRVVVLEERDQRGRDRHDLFGGHVHELILSGVESMNSFWNREETNSSLKRPFASSEAFACAITYCASSIADRYSIGR